MFKANYHTHSRFCDGTGEPAAYVQAALDKDFDALGFSSHAPCEWAPDSDWLMHPEDYEAYRAAVEKLKTEYDGRLEIYLGLECDYFGKEDPDFKSKYGLDYMIGSVHMLTDRNTGTVYSVDGSIENYELGIKEMFGGDIKKYVTEYYTRSCEMLDVLRPDIAGHMDLVRKNNKENRYFSTDMPWYREALMMYIEKLSRSGAVAEINTKIASEAWEPYPELWALKECRARGIRFTLSSDSHSPDNIDRGRECGIAKLLEAGYGSIWVLSKNRWVECPIGLE